MQNLKDTYGLPTLAGARNFVEALFGLEFDGTLTCTESEAEPQAHAADAALKLVCNIQGGAGSDVKVRACGPVLLFSPPLSV